MTSTLKNLGSCSVIALAIAGASPAMAGGTLAGSTITNTATVNYNVGTVARNASDNDAFVVDRKIDLIVDETNGVATTVAPGQTGAATIFTVQNTSNAVLDFTLTATQLAGGATAFSGTDTFNATNVKIYRDTNSNGTYEAGTDLEVTQSAGIYYLDEVAIDATVRLFVVGDMPTTLTGTDAAGVDLIATARAGGGAGALGAALTATATANNVAAMDTVFADGDGISDGPRDATQSDRDDWAVNAANLTVDKTSVLVSDPVNGTTNPYMIPGARVRYCLIVRNTGDGAATGVNLGDSLPSSLNLDATTLRINATVNDNGTPAVTTDDFCVAGSGTAGGTSTDAPDSVAWAIGTVNAGAVVAFTFEATVN